MSKYRTVCCAVGSGIAPFLIMSVYLCFSRWPTRWFTSSSDYAALGLSFAIGAAFFLRLPFPLWVRITGVVLYSVLLSCALTLYCLMFVGSFFNDWL